MAHRLANRFPCHTPRALSIHTCKSAHSRCLSPNTSRHWSTTCIQYLHQLWSIILVWLIKNLTCVRLGSRTSRNRPHTSWTHCWHWSRAWSMAPPSIRQSKKKDQAMVNRISECRPVPRSDTYPGSSQSVFRRDISSIMGVIDLELILCIIASRLSENT